MKNRQNNIIYICLLIVISCNSSSNNETCKYFNKDGQIIDSPSIEDKNNFFTGFKECYYQNGNIKEKSYYVKNQLNGIYQKYFDDGFLKISGNYKNNRKIGEWIIYEKGHIMRKERYILLNDSSYLNEFIVFDSVGNIIHEKSNFFSIGFEKDTIISGNVFKWQISNEAPMLEGDFYLILGSDLSIDSNYRIINKNQIDTLPYYKNATLAFKTAKQDSGKRILRGILIEEKEGKKYIKQRKQYFSIDFYCIPANHSP